MLLSVRFAGVDPRFGTFSIPVLFRDPAHAEILVTEGGGYKLAI